MLPPFVLLLSYFRGMQEFMGCFPEEVTKYPLSVY